MQELPFAPSLNIGFSIIALLALGLGLLALVAVVTVLVAARQPIIPFQQIKSVAVTLLWITPAVAVVVLIGYRLPHSQSGPAIYEELRSTIRDTISEPASTTVPMSLVTTAEIPPRTTAITAEAEQTAPLGETKTTGPGATPAVEVPLHRIAQDSPATEVRSTGDVSFNSPALDGVLKVLEARAGAPDWAGKEPVPGDHGILISLSSQRFATLREAEQQVTAQAVSYVKQFYHDEYPLSGDWTVPVAVIEKNAVHNLVGEAIDKDFGNGIHGTMYRAHLQLELNSAMRKALHDSWHGQIVSHRLTVLGSMLGLLTLMLATSAGYFRLDNLSGGLYRRRLKFAAVSLIAAGSLAALVIS